MKSIDLTRMTAEELRNIMKIIIFVLDNLYEDYRKPGISNKRLCQVYYKFFQMYITSQNELFTNNSCNQLQILNKYFTFLKYSIINN